MKQNSRILISGAGIAGLGCAAWLYKNGFSPIIVEKAKSVRAGGYLVSVSHHAYHFVEALGLLSELKKKDTGIRHSSYHDESGRNLLSLDYQNLFEKVDVIQPMRDGFAEVLYEFVKDHIEIRFDTSIVSLNQLNNVCQVEFTDGVIEEFDLVIGADGLHSNVRQLAFPDSMVKLHYLDLCCAAFKLPNTLNVENKFETHMHRDKYMAVFNTMEQDLGAVFVWESNIRKLPEDRRSVLQSVFKDASDTIQHVIKECPDTNDFYMDVLMQVEIEKWSNNRAVLLGDAAHCMTLFSGRGASAAFNGASRLAIAMSEMDIDAALIDYEKQMRPVISNIQPATRKAVKWYVPRTKLNHFIRNTSMRLLPNAFFQNYFRLKYTNI